MDMYSGIDFQSEFRGYAIKHLGVSMTQFNAWENIQNDIYSNVVVGSMTPYIIEERQMNITQMDIWSRLMMDRILCLAGPVNDRMSTVVQAQLLFLDNIGDEDITIYVDSPGGSVKSGLSIVDTMNYINSDISTLNTGMAASMGSILLGNGTKGKRLSLPNSKVMLHQVSSGYEGTHQDNVIRMAESEKYNNKLFKMLGEFTGKDPKEVMKDADRDLWLDADEALKYGLIDEIITKRKS